MPLLEPPATVSRIVYMGTPAMAVPPLVALHEAGFEIVLVVSGPDRRRGRGKDLSPSPVKAKALELGLTVTGQVDDVLSVDADLGVVVAFGQLIKPHLLSELAMVNLHFSLLPRWRGAAPVERAILAGDAVTGVDVMQLAEGLDTGDIYSEVELTIGDSETADELRERLVVAGSKLLVETLQAGLGVGRPQEGDPVYAKKIFADDLELDWSRPAIELLRIIRIGNAWTTFRGKRFKIWQAAFSSDGGSLAPGQIGGTRVGTGDGVIECQVVQPEGKARQDAEAWRNGAQPTSDETMGS